MSDTDAEPRPEEQPADDTMKVVILVLGVVSLMTCQLLGPVALMLGWVEYRKAHRAGRQADPLIIVGLALGAAATLLLVFIAVMFLAIGVVYCGLIGMYFVFMFLVLLLGAATGV